MGRLARRGARRAYEQEIVSRIVLICDEDRTHNEALGHPLRELGYEIQVARCYDEAFALACAIDLEGLLCAPFLRGGSALALPASLGIRRPPAVLLASRIGERLPDAVARRVGFDAQLSKVVDAVKLDRLIRGAVQARAAAARGEGARRVESYVPR